MNKVLIFERFSDFLKKRWTSDHQATISPKSSEGSWNSAVVPVKALFLILTITIHPSIFFRIFIFFMSIFCNILIHVKGIL